jgi:hypothetical protein
MNKSIKEVAKSLTTISFQNIKKGILYLAKWDLISILPFLKILYLFYHHLHD